MLAHVTARDLPRKSLEELAGRRLLRHDGGQRTALTSNRERSFTVDHLRAAAKSAENGDATFGSPFHSSVNAGIARC